MRRFLFQCLIFWICFCAVYISIMLIATGNYRSVFRTNDDTHIVFLGNSHLECGINDAIIPGTLNFARSGERMEWIYAKLRLLTDANPQIDTVFIGFDNVLCFKDAINEDVHMGHNSPYFMRYVSFVDAWHYLTQASGKYNFDMITKTLSINQLYEIYRERHSSARECAMGGFVPSNRDKLKEDMSRQANSITESKQFDHLSHYYLDKAIDYCRQRNITVIFICPPQHSMSHLDNTTYRIIAQKYYSGIEFWDYCNYPLPDSAFQDLDHLNSKGADIFSNSLKKRLSRGNEEI